MSGASATAARLRRPAARAVRTAGSARQGGARRDSGISLLAVVHPAGYFKSYVEDSSQSDVNFKNGAFCSPLPDTHAYYNRSQALGAGVGWLYGSFAINWTGDCIGGLHTAYVITGTTKQALVRTAGLSMILAWPILMIVAGLIVWRYRSAVGEEGPGRGPRWFGAWSVAGFLMSFSLIAGLSIGLLILPIAAFVLLWVSRHSPRLPEATGFLAGMAVTAVVVAALAAL